MFPQQLNCLVCTWPKMGSFSCAPLFRTKWRCQGFPLLRELSVLRTVHLVQTKFIIMLSLQVGHRETVVLVQRYFFCRIKPKWYKLRKVCDIRAATSTAFCTYGYLKIFSLPFNEVIGHCYLLSNFPLTVSCIQIWICVFSQFPCPRLTFFTSLSETEWLFDSSKNNMTFVFIYLIKIDTKRFQVLLKKTLIGVVRESMSGELVKRDRCCVSPILSLAKPYPTHSLLLFNTIRPNSSHTSAADK